MTRLLIDNSGRSGVAANITVNEFNEAVFYPGTEEDNARYRVEVKSTRQQGYMVPLMSGFMTTYTFS